VSGGEAARGPHGDHASSSVWPASEPRPPVDGPSPTVGCPALSRSGPFPEQARVKLRRHFQLAQSRGRKVHTTHFVLCVLPRSVGAGGGFDGARLGVTVTRKIAGAVGRNRVKRVVREVFRCNRSQFPSGSDVVVIAKHGAPDLSYADAEGELLGALRRRRP